VPRLLTFLSERDTDLSDSATRNLGKIQPDLIVRRLIKQLDASGGPVMLQAGIISALGEFGSNAKAAIPLIIPFLNAADADTRTAATNALNAIDAVAAAKAGAK